MTLGESFNCSLPQFPSFEKAFKAWTLYCLFRKMILSQWLRPTFRVADSKIMLVRWAILIILSCWCKALVEMQLYGQKKCSFLLVIYVLFGKRCFSRGNEGAVLPAWCAESECQHAPPQAPKRPEVTWIDECLAKPEAIDLAERKGVLAKVWLCGHSAYRWAAGRASSYLCHALWEDVSRVSARRACPYNHTWKPLLAQSRPEQISNPSCSTFPISLVSFNCYNVIATINNKLTGFL